MAVVFEILRIDGFAMDRVGSRIVYSNMLHNLYWGFPKMKIG